jgi:hypothetical protein
MTCYLIILSQHGMKRDLGDNHFQSNRLFKKVTSQFLNDFLLWDLIGVLKRAFGFSLKDFAVIK